MANKTGRTIKGLDPEARRRQRKDELLESALDLFAANGYANTSIEQICQHATVGYKAFYDEFATKEQLFIELYDAIGGRLLPAVLEAIAEPAPGDELLPLMISSPVPPLPKLALQWPEFGVQLEKIPAVVKIMLPHHGALVMLGFQTRNP